MSNLGFEDDDPAQPGNPENWILVGTWSPTTAQFDATVGLTSQDTFEEGWGANDYLDDPPVSSFVAGSFGVTLDETFEDGWGATPYKTEPPIGTVDIAMFNGVGVDPDETFETEWGATPYLTAPPVGIVTFATFNAGADLEEAFETEWGAPTPAASYLETAPTNSVVSAKFRRKLALDKFFTVNVATSQMNVDHDLILGDEVVVSSTVTLPTPLVAGVLYYVSAVLAPNQIAISATLGGASIVYTDAGAGIHQITHEQQFEDFEPLELERQFVVDVVTDRLTVSEELPLGFVIGDRISFRTTGQLPSPLNPSYTYRVEAVFTVFEFRVASVEGGAQIDITDSGVGEHFVGFDPVDYWTSENDSV